jgi:LasA protease
MRELDHRSTWDGRLSSWQKLPALAVLLLMSYQAMMSYSTSLPVGRMEAKALFSGLFTRGEDLTPLTDEQPGAWIYYTQSGDTLETVAARFQVRPQDIQIPYPLREDQLLDPGLRLVIHVSGQTLSDISEIMPDYEVVYSPAVQGFDTWDYVAQAAGYLSTHQEYMRSTGMTSGAEIVERVALENSFNPRLLLALLEYHCGCILGPLAEGVEVDYLMGVNDPSRKGLYRQLGWVVNQLSLGYYGRKQGYLNNLVFFDGSSAHLPPDLNAGSVSIAYLFSRMYDRKNWLHAVDPSDGFKKLYEHMYNTVWIDTEFEGDLFPASLKQPVLILPFQQDRGWGYTSGPHEAWETEGALAALDFAPASEHFGCDRSDAWVVAVANGFVVRSELGAVVLDLDGDGFEGTGWTVLYMHIEDRQRVAEGTYLNRGDKIGHPSCEGGPADGTHVHIARKYNGEWIAADGPLPFVMSGWVAQAGYRPFEGSLSRGDQVVVANPLSPAEAFISLSASDVLLYLDITRDLWWEYK